MQPHENDILRWGEIPTTQWTLVDRAGRDLEASGAAGGAPGRRLALDELVRIYLPVLRGHLRYTLRLRDDAVDDLLQGFLADRVVSGNLIGQANPARGQFRRFLLTALNHYVVDQQRRAAASRRRPTQGPPVSVDAIPEPGARGDLGRTAEQHFDRLWANEVLAEVMRRTRLSCERNGRPDLWTVLEQRVLLPATLNVPPVPHAELARRLDLPTASQAANLLTTAKQAFVRVFRTVVAEYVGDQQAELDEEIRQLWQIFAAARR